MCTFTLYIVHIQKSTTTYNSVPAYLLAYLQMQRTRMSDLPMLMTNASKQARKPESYPSSKLCVTDQVMGVKSY